MSETEKSFIKHFRQQVIATIASQFIIIVLLAIAFYFNTNNTLDNHTEDINWMKVEIGTKASKKELNKVEKNTKESMKEIVRPMQEDIGIIKEHILNNKR